MRKIRNKSQLLTGLACMAIALAVIPFVIWFKLPMWAIATSLPAVIIGTVLLAHRHKHRDDPFNW